jgi:hypothetical protein
MIDSFQWDYQTASFKEGLCLIHHCMPLALKVAKDIANSINICCMLNLRIEKLESAFNPVAKRKPLQILPQKNFLKCCVSVFSIDKAEYHRLGKL